MYQWDYEVSVFCPYASIEHEPPLGDNGYDDVGSDPQVINTLRFNLEAGYPEILV